MRVLKTPSDEAEIGTVVCSCGAELAYTRTDMHYVDSVPGTIYAIICPCCHRDIRITYNQHPNNMEKAFIEFYY